MFGVKVYDRQNKMDTQIYIISFLGVRYLFLILAFIRPSEDGCFDVMFMMAIFFFNAVMFFRRKPLYGLWNNNLGRFNTFAMLVCCYHLIMFTDAVEKDTQYHAGWSLITAIVIFIIVNLLYFAGELVYVLDSLLRFIYNRGLITFLQPIIDFFRFVLEQINLLWMFVKENTSE